MDSILDSTKAKLGISSDYEAFDEAIISLINSAFYVLYQLGVGDDPSHPFRIESDAEKWSDFITDGRMDACKDAIYFRVKLGFDPPSNSFLVENMKEQLKEYEWRLTVGADELKT